MLIPMTRILVSQFWEYPTNMFNVKADKHEWTFDIHEFVSDICKCFGKGDLWNNGAECQLEKSMYMNNSNEYNNRMWCYAEIATCSDARAHPTDNEEYGISYKACEIGKRRGNVYLSKLER